MADLQEIKVWDPLVRIFHWVLVAAVAVAWMSEDDWMGIHSFAGYLVMGLLLLRLVWGFIGPRYARFTDFVRPPREVWVYLKEIASLKAPRHIGHNPVGGAMIMALLICLALTVISGLSAYGAEGGGPLAGRFGGLGEFIKEALEEVHEFFANFTLFLAAVHLGGVLLESLLHRENLVRAMITGRKRVDG
jgi:cytochrome b